MRILVVDPTTRTQQFLCFVLGEAGHVVVPVPNGTLALQQVKQQVVGAVLLEAELPDMDGCELCKE
ncbi:MAG: response regulator, partial [Sphaerobacter sp.]|nr:response regulator [Sphaerobacter sp.]